MLSQLDKPLLVVVCLLICVFQQTAFTSKKDYGTEDRAAKWVLSQGSLQGLNQVTSGLEVSGRRSSMIAEQARRRAEIARYVQFWLISNHLLTCFS
jgi:H+-transporting ATPase